MLPQGGRVAEVEEMQGGAGEAGTICVTLGGISVISVFLLSQFSQNVSI